MTEPPDDDIEPVSKREEMHYITIGFEFHICCFPLTERENWMLGWHGSKSLCFGPLRFYLARIRVLRAMRKRAGFTAL